MYLGKPPWDTGISPPELLEFIASHAPGRAIDLGCGTGTNAITLASHGWQVTGIDFAGRAIRSARHKARQVGLEIDFRQGDVTKLTHITGPFDLVLDIGCLHSLDVKNKQRYAANLPRIMAPGGTFLIYAWMDEEGNIGTGLRQEDLKALTAEDRENGRLRLVERQDGTERGVRPSAWLRFQFEER